MLPRSPGLHPSFRNSQDVTSPGGGLGVASRPPSGRVWTAGRLCSSRWRCGPWELGQAAPGGRSWDLQRRRDKGVGTHVHTRAQTHMHTCAHIQTHTIHAHTDVCTCTHMQTCAHVQTPHTPPDRRLVVAAGKAGRGSGVPGCAGALWLAREPRTRGAACRTSASSCLRPGVPDHRARAAGGGEPGRVRCPGRSCPPRFCLGAAVLPSADREQ